MKIILIEGLDLVGKSTIAKKLVEKHNNIFLYSKGPYTSINLLYDETVKKSKTGMYSNEYITNMYLQSAYNELSLLEKEKTDKIVIQDSFFLNRMIGLHGVGTNEKLIKEINDLLDKFPIPLKSFYIYSDLKTRRERFKKRVSEKKPALGDKLVFENDEIAAKREENYRLNILYRYDADFIDNTNGNIDEIVEYIYEQIMRLAKEKTKLIRK